MNTVFIALLCTTESQNVLSCLTHMLQLEYAMHFLKNPFPISLAFIVINNCTNVGCLHRFVVVVVAIGLVVLLLFCVN